MPNTIKITSTEMKVIPINPRKRAEKFHVYLSKADVEQLRQGYQVTRKVHAGIYAFINRVHNDYAANCVIQGIPCELNLYCPTEEDFQVHVTKTGRRSGEKARL